jgi:predicted DNA-binding protein YlxM (UPF0122 family)
MVILNPNAMEAKKYFLSTEIVIKKKYDALRSYFVDCKSVQEVAQNYNYTLSSFYSLIRDFKKHLNEFPEEDYFFQIKYPGKHKSDVDYKLDELIITLRKKNFSIPDIKVILDTQGYNVSESYCYRVLSSDGFSRLPRRTRSEITSPLPIKLAAPKSIQLKYQREIFSSNSVGMLCMLPYIKKSGLDTIINNSPYPGTKSINKLSSILSFISLKISNIRRYSADDLWCMDRGSGLFAGLNVLPKAAWFTSYSSRITREMNLDFLRSLHKVWMKHGLLDDTVNLDFTTIPYWGEGDHLENNWSGKRKTALTSILAVLAQNPDTGIIDYGDTNVKHQNESDVILEYLDFYNSSNSNKQELKYLVFDSKFTNYQNLGILNRKEIKFITIRRRGKHIVERLDKIHSSEKRKIRVECAGNKKRTLNVYEEYVMLKGYNPANISKNDMESVRQVSITGHGKIKPALIITNDFDISLNDLIRKYSKRWIVEKGISEQIEFFHLNKVSSSMVIKVDFDLTMSILAHNLYRVFSSDLEDYKHLCSQGTYEKFIRNSGTVEITNKEIIISLKKKRNLPAILTSMKKYENYQYEYLGNKKLKFRGASNS